jgi:beta-glucanase (GH16 family)
MRNPLPRLYAIGLLALVWMEASPLFGEPPTGWNLVFSDEFDGQTLDTNKWTTAMDFVGTQGPRYHNEFYQSYTLDEDVVVAAGSLHLRTERHTVAGTEPIGLFEYSQGLVSTEDKFTFTFGYVEIRAKYPGGKGLWPCFWLMPQNQGNWPPEFDIAEYYGGQHKMHFGLAHGTMRDAVWDSSGDTQTEFANNWHTFALEWRPGHAVWYVDGVARKTVSADYVPSVPMYVILSNSISSRLGPSGEPDENTVFPNDFEIDYIRIYQPPPVIVKAEPPAKPAAPETKPSAAAANPIIAVLPGAPLP